jgi:SAM-dependent methyltransferase
MPKPCDHWSTGPAEYEARRGGHLHARRVGLILAGLRAGRRRPDMVVELGCATGALLCDVAAALPSSTVCGIDIDADLIEYARTHHPSRNSTWLVADATRPLPACDGVYSVDVLHHIKDQAGTVESVREALRSGGRWVIIEPNILHLYVTWQQESMRRSGLDEDHFRPWRVVPLLRQAGFSIVSRTYAHLYPGQLKRVVPPLAALERAVERCPILGGSIVLVAAAP